MFCYKIFESGSDKLLAVCDAGISGKTLADGDFEMKIDPSFYGNEKVDAASVLKAAKKSTIINAIGNDIVDLLIDEKVVEKSSVISIGKVKHAQVISISY